MVVYENAALDYVTFHIKVLLILSSLLLHFVFFSVVMCPALLDPLNGNVLWSDLSVHSGATYTCNSGFELVGNELRTYLSDGVWSNEEPVCRGA